MSEPILIGTYGWEHAAWEGIFYPPELPVDWRFCYFSNNIRSVIVPAEVWARVAPADIEQWVTDSDPGFRFVLELPPDLLASDDPRAAVERFFAPLAPLHALTAGLLLPASSSMTRSRLDVALDALIARHPVCLRPLGEVDDVLRELAARHQTSVCWQVGQEREPEQMGQFLVALMPAADPRSLRTTLERLASWQGELRHAGLYFTQASDASRLVQQARLLAEMMQV